MSEPDIIPTNFTISSAAKLEFENLRRAFDERTPRDPAAVLMVGWGLYHLNSGERFERVVVSYYQRSQLAEVSHGIQEVSGVKLVFFTTMEYSRHFDGKVLDHSDERSFFLRNP